MSRAEPMDEAEIDGFLGNEGTGTLAFAQEDESYAIPISYGFDATDGTFYFRLAFHPDSEKRAFLGPDSTVSFVVSEETDEGWRSVVARGHLRETGEAAIDSSVVEAIRRVNIPFFTVFDRPARDLDFQLFRLRPDELTGHKQT
ncbi:pyridoxamine 5'-phosphate oxidase family protein [Salinigranum salinum]|uniref:pyridoxamine 5'-phosphate oxidase family protein n=1 Tax=Salinigranum salinum TaxID=1364937 RepID=UPI001957C9D3|nr:pyridoxamine 5'-phosphate oxidase family protein [Salinigranum salinum]